MNKRAALIFLSMAMWIAATTGDAVAQSGPTPDDLTLRPGDTITWSGPGHVVQFGGSAAGVTLTPLADVQKILTFTPPLDVNDGAGFSTKDQVPLVTAKLNANADQQGVSAFDFICAIHAPLMHSRPFTVAPKAGHLDRTVKIKAVGTSWMLETAHGDVLLDK
jgi:plastocyanin